MQLYLLRHGIAEEGGVGLNDADRALTAQGRRKLRQVLQAALEAQVKPTLILSSPLKRAVQTAEIVKKVLGYKDEILLTKVLVPGSTVELVWEEICVHKEEEALMLVGHNPLFDSLAGYLLGQVGMELDFKKGAILRVDLDRFSAHPKGVLRWYITPKLAASRQ